jgi:hypothetical protein
MAEEVYMDIPHVEQMAKNFKTFGEVLNGIAKALQIIINVLYMTAFISLGTTEGLRIYLQNIKPNFTTAASKMNELSDDVHSAVNSYRTGDTQGSRRFC